MKYPNLRRLFLRIHYRKGGLEKITRNVVDYEESSRKMMHILFSKRGVHRLMKC